MKVSGWSRLARWAPSRMMAMGALRAARLFNLGPAVVAVALAVEDEATFYFCGSQMTIISSDSAPSGSPCQLPYDARI